MLSSESLHSLPCPTVAATLAPAMNHHQPEFRDLIDETTQSMTVARDGMVTQPAANHLSKALACFINRSVPPLEPLRTHPFRNRLAMNRKPALLPSRSTLVRETKKVKRLWSTITVSSASLNRVLAKFYQTSLAYVQL